MSVLLNFICIKYVIFSIIFCHGFKEVLASLDCNFDDDLCGWENEKGAYFEWLREFKYTPSSNTGPHSDHTTGEDGHYIYIEASDQDKGDKARLISPVQSSGTYCLIFWYNMYGKDMGTLNIYMKLNGGIETILFTRDRTSDDRNWRKEVINYNANDTHQIVIEGIRGDGTKSDIAVDDISMIYGWCSLDCNFDIGLCDWIQADRDDFDWALHKGPTFTNNTGPESDHTTGTGQYIYMETTYKSKNEIAAVVSPLQISGKYCFSFWYYMFGEHVGNLEVELWYENGTIQTFFMREEDQGRKWIQHNGFINSETNFQVAFVGRVKNAKYRFEGDIAIDDVEMFSCHDCGNRRILNGKFIAPNGTTVGQIAKQDCNIGYTLIGDVAVTCTTSGWNGTTVTCKLIDCNKREIINGMFTAPNGTTFGQTALKGCNTGYTLVGDAAVICTAYGWNDTAVACKIIDGTDSSVIAVYVIAPVVVLILVILFMVLFLSRKAPKCMKILEAKHDSRCNRMTFPNKTYGDHDLGSKIHINPSREDESSQSNNEYAAITGDQEELKETSDAIYYNAIGIAEDNYDHKSNTIAHFVDDYTYDSSYNTVSKKGNTSQRKQAEAKSYDSLINCNKITQSHKENEESDYDHAKVGVAAPVTSEQDDYSRLNDVIIKNKHTACIDKDLGNDDEVEYSNVDKGIQRK